ncbi:uncharacterized protein LOC142334247 [Lycorma delicatula]|uniref:uncharacterized protein LOC142334247 n=1 Tax=Lycorma delicatula TaxID=130591 RepID=UPI003F5157BF
MDQTVVVLFIAFASTVCRGSIISTQFHSQDGSGGYSFGHSGGPSSKTEHGTADGRVSGSYSYVDGNGIVQTATYTADSTHGFQVHASNLPVAPNPAPVSPSVPNHISAPVYRPLGVPVVDTPEVAAAKAGHLAAVEHQKVVIASHPYRRRRQVHWLPHPALGFSYHTSTAHVPVPVIHNPYPYPLASHEIGVPVTDTPEVAAAKTAHLSAVQHAKIILGVH